MRRSVDLLPSDTELVLAARAGDECARTDLFSRHVDTVRAVCASRLDSAHDVADAVQETLVRALSRLQQLDDPSRVDAWLRAIAARVCVDQGRQRARLVYLADPAADRTSVDPDPIDVLVAAEDAARVREQLGQLRERDQRALWMRDAIGLSIAELAGDLGLTEGSVRVLLTRARKRLRATYHGLGGLILVSGARLRQRLAALGDMTPVDVRAALAAQFALTVAVGVTVSPAAVEPAPLPPPPAPASATVASAPSGPPEPGGTGIAGTDDVSAPTESVDATPVPSPTDDRPDAVVDVGDSPPQEAEAVEVSTRDEDGEVLGLLVYLGDTFGSDDEEGDERGPSGDEDRWEISPQELAGR
jgi:RNA polymerase sigma factor (sigma-70 family)